MTPTEFVRALEEYYGPYERDAIKGSVLLWARERGGLLEVFSKVRKEYGTQYKTQPDVAALEKLVGSSPPRNGDWKDEHGNTWVYRDGARVGHRDGRLFIPDLRRVATERKRELADMAADNPAAIALDSKTSETEG